MYENPFKCGVPVTGSDFVDREEERKRLASDLLSGQSVILYSPRRLGKSSLIKQVLLDIPRERAHTIYIELYGVSSKRELAHRIVNETMSSIYPTYSSFKKAATRLLRAIPVKVISIGKIFRIDVGKEMEDSQDMLEDAFELPERVGNDTNKKVIVAFDEFQDVASLDGGHIEKLMRSKFQHHKKAAYLFAGSRTTMIMQMFENPERAFYRFGTQMKIDNIPKDKFEKFIQNKFRKTGKNIPPGMTRQILDITKGQPYATQRICQQVWYNTEKTVDEADINRAVSAILDVDADRYEAVWDALSPGQRNFLKGILFDPPEKKYTFYFINKHGLKSTAHVKRIFDSLSKKGIIDKSGAFTDNFFRMWLIGVLIESDAEETAEQYARKDRY